jgi:hypothetical protein
MRFLDAKLQRQMRPASWNRPSRERILVSREHPIDAGAISE